MVNRTDYAEAAIRLDVRRRGRVLIYSHDTFGLGHLRRSRAIANALVEEHPGLSVIILSGSPVIGNFEFRQWRRFRPRSGRDQAAGRQLSQP